MADAVAKIASAQVVVKHKPGGGPVSRYVPRTTRAAAELSLHTWLSLDDSLARTWNYYRNHS